MNENLQRLSVILLDNYYCISKGASTPQGFSSSSKNDNRAIFLRRTIFEIS